MNRRIVLSRAGIVAGALTLMLALAACKDDEDDATTTCDDLQQEANGCQTATQAEKDQFAKIGGICKAQARFTADCRTCLRGKVCGVTEQCDPLCGK